MIGTREINLYLFMLSKTSLGKLEQATIHFCKSPSIYNRDNFSENESEREHTLNLRMCLCVLQAELVSLLLAILYFQRDYRLMR